MRSTLSPFTKHAMGGFSASLPRSSVDHIAGAAICATGARDRPRTTATPADPAAAAGSWQQGSPRLMLPAHLAPISKPGPSASGKCALTVRFRPRELGDEGYSCEELVAELGSAFCAPTSNSPGTAGGQCRLYRDVAGSPKERQPRHFCGTRACPASSRLPQSESRCGSVGGTGSRGKLIVCFRSRPKFCCIVPQGPTRSAAEMPEEARLQLLGP